MYVRIFVCKYGHFRGSFRVVILGSNFGVSFFYCHFWSVILGLNFVVNFVGSCWYFFVFFAVSKFKRVNIWKYQIFGVQILGGKICLGVKHFGGPKILESQNIERSTFWRVNIFLWVKFFGRDKT